MITRRRFVTGALASGALLVGAAAGTFAGDLSAAPARAAVYRGRGAGTCDGCSEAVAGMLGSGATPFDVEFVGPDDVRQVTPETLQGFALYAQPGGGSVEAAWAHLSSGADAIRRWVHGGGNYLGICLGAYLAGSDPGYGLFPGRVYRYIDSPDAVVDTADYTSIETNWGGEIKKMYFQDGPAFEVAAGAPATVMATYPGGEAAAVVASYGSGRIGLIGPHPEASLDWFGPSTENPQESIHPDLGQRLITRTVAMS